MWGAIMPVCRLGLLATGVIECLAIWESIYIILDSAELFKLSIFIDDMSERYGLVCSAVLQL